MSKLELVKNLPVDSENQARVFTLDELCTNPDNPRKTRNPRFEDLKASIRACGLESVPLVTRDPRLPEGVWTFSNGGNTRYTIMRELWDETGDERFYRMTCVVKAWPGRFQCLTGHLAENETHGQLTFIDKALSVRDARNLLEEERGKKVSLRELAAELSANGLPVHFSSVSRMEDVVRNIYPWMPVLLESGFGGQGLRRLLKLRHGAEKIWEKYQAEKGVETEADFSGVFGECCRKFDDPELWSLEMFTDELIGDLTDAFPCPGLDYDGWLLELRGANKTRAEPVEDIAINVTQNLQATPFKGANDDAVVEQATSDIAHLPDCTEDAVVTSKEADIPESYSSKKEQKTSGLDLMASVKLDEDETALALQHDDSLQPAAQTDTHSLWHINALQDDIDHLQSIAWRLCWDIADAHGCSDTLASANENELSPGYRLSVPTSNAPEVACFLASLTGETATIDFQNLLSKLLIGLSESTTPVFDDEQTLIVFRLIRILRRLRELQRKGAAINVPVNEG